MRLALSKIKKLNSVITKRIIELQDQGYLYDFKSLDSHRFVCLQDSVCFEGANISIKLIDQVYDQFSHSYKYIHSIETETGHKGLLLEEGIFTH